MENQRCSIDPTRECIGAAMVESMEAELNQFREHARETHGKLFDRMRQIEIAQTETRTEYGNIMEKLGDLKKDISSIKEKPAKRWESLVDKVLWLVLGSVLTFVLCQIGLPGV